MTRLRSVIDLEGTTRALLQDPIDMLESLSVTDVDVTIVKPLGKTTHPETIDPTILDMWTRDLYPPKAFVYRLEKQPRATDYLQLVSRMKDSLAKVLTSFYPFAGRWVETSQGYGRQLLCNDAGVPFIEAYAEEDLDHVLPAGIVDNLGTLTPARLSALHTKSFDIVGLDSTQYRQIPLAKGLPCLFIQVTRFKCGGVVLSPTYNHMLCDGRGFINFMQAWSDIALTGQTARVPDFNRALADSPIFKDVFAVTSGSADESFEPLSKAVFQVKKDIVESMKQEVKVKTNGAHYVGKQDCVRAHIWQAILRLPPSITGVEQVEEMSAVEGRTRFFDPPLSEQFCGNAVLTMLFPNTYTAKQLLDMPASLVALNGRQKLAATSQQDWKIRLMEMRDTFGRKNSFIWLQNSLLNFPYYEIDFGFGKPFFIFPAGLFGKFGKFLGRSIICPPIPSNHESAATLHLDTTPEVIKALQSDSKFMSMFLEN